MALLAVNCPVSLTPNPVKLVGSSLSPGRVPTVLPEPFLRACWFKSSIVCKVSGSTSP